MEHAHRTEVPLTHQVEVAKATQVLMRCLGCDDWYVACHQEHQYVYRFSNHGIDRYAVSFQCTPPVDKGIYHGSKAWALSLIPLHGAEDLPEVMVEAIRTELLAVAEGPNDRARAY